MYRFHSIAMPSVSPHSSIITRSCSIFRRSICSQPSSHPRPSPPFIFSASLLDCLWLLCSLNWQPRTLHPSWFFPKHVYVSLHRLGERVQHCNTAAGVSKADAVFASFACMIIIGDHTGWVCNAASPVSIPTVITPTPPRLLDQMFLSSSPSLVFPVSLSSTARAQLLHFSPTPLPAVQFGLIEEQLFAADLS